MNIESEHEESTENVPNKVKINLYKPLGLI